MSGKWEASTTGIVVQILCRNTSRFLPSISIPASTAFTPTGDLSAGEREVEEAKRKGLVVAVVGSVKDKAPELLVAEGLVRHAVNRQLFQFKFLSAFSNHSNAQVRLGVGRVATLHGGIEVFRGTSNLVLPNV